MKKTSVNLESEFENAVNAVRNAFNNKVGLSKKLKHIYIIHLINCY